jgi:hypothetical protein
MDAAILDVTEIGAEVRKLSSATSQSASPRANIGPDLATPRVRRDAAAVTGIVRAAMEAKDRLPIALEIAARARAAGERADLDAKSAPDHLRRAAAALPAQGYGSSRRRSA